ncbi:cytochrome P450 [Rhodocollybia butyracea]|uniref:Cytochrome P450 n=1 Tax=Rhodocollybia butyracea TaxID=206335 RepID=A0A9P5PJC3_9AGAR|nr:cytochrome P450 [Rhodocollybia butyracea]
MHASALLFLTLVLVLCARWRNSPQYPLPPGPKKLPILGNLFDIPRKSFIWLDYIEMCRKYGSDIIHLSALGNSIIVLDSAQAVSDLLEKRSSLYSSRPKSTMLNELLGWGGITIARPNDDIWKSQRRIFANTIPVTDVKRFHAKQIAATHDLLRALAHSDDIIRDLYTGTTVLIMDITYGIQGEEALPFIKTAVEVVDTLAIATAPGAFLVDQISILKYVPEWFPGAGFKRKAREWNLLRTKMTEDPFRVTKERMVAGTATPCLASAAFEQIDLTKDIAQQEEIIKAASVMTHIGGTDTIVATIASFILAMLMNPDMQTRAQRELDRVLAPGDLPTFSLEPDLPYIQAIVWEALRHQPAVPLCFPHLVTEDDVYSGYLIPKDSIIMPNIWSILHNEEDYPDPYRFNPSRFLDADGKIDPSVKHIGPAFGFGRRACPGKELGLASLWINIASILACYRIEPEIDEHGNLAEPKAEWYPGLTMFNHPLPFKCRFIPRSKDIEVSLDMKVT